MAEITVIYIKISIVFMAYKEYKISELYVTPETSTIILHLIL